MGTELEAVVDRSGGLSDTIDQVGDQLEAVRASVIEALRMISQVQLSLPGIFPSEAIVNGELDLRALMEGLDDLSHQGQA
jgi:hypothetical protein